MLASASAPSPAAGATTSTEPGRRIAVAATSGGGGGAAGAGASPAEATCASGNSITTSGDANVPAGPSASSDIVRGTAEGSAVNIATKSPSSSAVAWVTACLST